jgi:hypothetical protein
MMDWPSLPESGFVTGRHATFRDLEAGDAVFVQRLDDQEACGPTPCILVPQYAIWHSDDGTEVPVILVQVEANASDPLAAHIMGLRTLAGKDILALGSEVSLLGQSIPGQSATNDRA